MQYGKAMFLHLDLAALVCLMLQDEIYRSAWDPGMFAKVNVRRYAGASFGDDSSARC